MYFKILNNLVAIPAENLFMPIKNNYIVTRGHNFKLTKKLCQTDQFVNSFANRSVNVWNSLDTNIVNAMSLNVFKSLVNKLDLNNFTRGRALVS